MDAITVLHAGMKRWQQENTPPCGFSSNTPKWEEHEVTRQIDRDTVLNEFAWYARYADKRESQSKLGIIVGDWNKIPQRYQNYLERRGFRLDWPDSTSCCDGCGDLIPTEPDSWFWRPNFWVSEGSITCNACTDWGEVLDSKLARYKGVNTWQCEPKDYGWFLLEECFELAEGLAAAKQKGYERAVVLSGRSDVVREVWVKGAIVDVPLMFRCQTRVSRGNTEEIQVGAPI